MAHFTEFINIFDQNTETNLFNFNYVCTYKHFLTAMSHLRGFVIRVAIYSFQVRVYTNNFSQ